MEILNHISKNFVLFGLGSEESAIIQCVRELFENSKDAIKKMHLISNSKLFDGEIIIRLNNDQEIHNQIILTVEDNGIGMESPISCLLCFNSLRVHDLSQEETKEVSNKLELNGKYGIGLSACVLYSQLKSLGPYIHITSKFINKNYVETFDFKFDLSSGYPEVIQSNVVDMNINHGTLVKMMLPMNFKHRNFEKIHEALCLYIFRTQILPTNRCSIRFILNLEFKDQIGETFRSERKDVLQKAKNLDFKKDSFTEGEYRSMLVENFKSSIEKSESCKISGVSFVEDESGNSIKASAILITDKRKNNREDGSFKPVSFELQIWRFVNGTPLLDFVNDTVSCELFKSVTSINWTEYGHKLNFSMNGSKTGNSSINLEESYELVLTPINEEYLPDELGILIPKVLIIFLDYNSDEGLQKTSLSQNEKIRRLVNRGVRNVMDSITKQSFGLFMSANKQFDHHALNVCIPSLASSIRKILSCQDNETKYTINKIFNMNLFQESNNNSEDIEAFFSKKIKGVLSSKGMNFGENNLTSEISNLTLVPKKNTDSIMNSVTEQNYTQDDAFIFSLKSEYVCPLLPPTDTNTNTETKTKHTSEISNMPYSFNWNRHNQLLSFFVDDSEDVIQNDQYYYDDKSNGKSKLEENNCDRMIIEEEEEEEEDDDEDYEDYEDKDDDWDSILYEEEEDIYESQH